MSDNKVSYKTVTETPDTHGSREQIERLYTRYRFAAGFSKDKDVLEVACGAGLGVGYLARVAKKVVAGDIDPDNLDIAKKTYKGRPNIEIIKIDAQELPFGDNSFDVVIFYEAIYYLKNPGKFVEEAGRVLRKGGALIICSANKDWPAFNPSPMSVRYFSAPELHLLLTKRGFDVELYADCHVDESGFKNKVVSLIKQGAVKLNLMPKTMKGKEALKRVFFGALKPLPPEITDGMAEYCEPVRIPHDEPITDYKVLYIVGHAN